MTLKVEKKVVKDEAVKDKANSNKTKLNCNPKRILQAISVLRQLDAKYYETCKKKPFLEDISDNPIFLQFTLKKIPALKWRQCVKVPLPNPLVKDKTEICLITGDLDKRNTKAEIDPDILHYKELLKSQNITQISEVITLRQLRTEYKSFEARRNLYGAYDIFLCDKKIAGVLPKTLGKRFYGSRKIPIQINMASKNLKDTIDNSLKNAVFCLTCRGNCCSIEVASLSMKDDEILSNISSSIDILKDKLPGQVDNIMGLYVKTARSKALPIYMSFEDPNDVKVKKRKFKKEKVEAEEITTVLGATVKVYKSGRVIVKKIKSKRKSALKMKINKDKKADQDNTVVDDLEDPTPCKKIKKEKRADQDNTVIDDLEDPTPGKKIKKEKRADQDITVIGDLENPTPGKKIKKQKKADQDSTVIDDLKDSTPHKKNKKKKRADTDVDVKAEGVMNEDINTVSVVRNGNETSVPNRRKKTNIIKDNSLSEFKKVKKSKLKGLNNDMQTVRVAVKKDETGVSSDNKLISKSVKKNFKTVSGKNKKADTNVIQKPSPKLNKVKENIKTDKKLKSDTYNIVQKPKKKKVKTSK